MKKCKKTFEKSEEFWTGVQAYDITSQTTHLKGTSRLQPLKTKKVTLSGSHPYGSKGEARTWDKIYKYNYYTSTTLHIQEASGCSARWAGDDVTRALSSWDKGHVLKDGVSRPINTSGSWRRRARYSKMASHYPMIVRTSTGEVEPAALSGGSTSGGK